MDETGLREVLVQVAEDQLPPSRVAIGLASRRGRRRTHWRRVYLPFGAPVAAAAGVALIAGLPQAFTSNSQPPKTPPAAQHGGNPPKVPPRAFSLLEPFALFGWLPLGLSASASTFGPGLSGYEGSQEEMLNAEGDGGDKILRFIVYPRDAVRLARQGSKLYLVNKDYPGRVLVTGKAQSVRGRSAFWLQGNTGWLRGSTGRVMAWQYARSGWAILCGLNTGRSYRQVPSVRYNSAKFRYGFEYRGAPAGWRQSQTAPSLNLFGIDDAAPIRAGWYLSPLSNGSGGLTIIVLPDAISPVNDACEVPPGARSRSVKLDGTSATLWTVNAPDEHDQQLCDEHLHGVSLGIIVNQNESGSNVPVPGVGRLGGVLGVFRHLRLLGPDIRNWTTNPLH